MGDVLVMLGRVHAATGRLDEAEADLRRALTIMERSQGPTGESAAVCAALLADVLDRRGEQAEANTLFDRATTTFRGMAPRSGYSTLAASAALADHYRKLGRRDDEPNFGRLVR